MKGLKYRLDRIIAEVAALDRLNEKMMNGEHPITVGNVLALKADTARVVAQLRSWRRDLDTQEG